MITIGISRYYYQQSSKELDGHIEKTLTDIRQTSSLLSDEIRITLNTLSKLGLFLARTTAQEGKLNVDFDDDGLPERYWLKDQYGRYYVKWVNGTLGFFEIGVPMSSDVDPNDPVFTMDSREERNILDESLENDSN